MMKEQDELMNILLQYVLSYGPADRTSFPNPSHLPILVPIRREYTPMYGGIHRQRLRERGLREKPPTPPREGQRDLLGQCSEAALPPEPERPPRVWLGCRSAPEKCPRKCPSLLPAAGKPKGSIEKQGILPPQPFSSLDCSLGAQQCPCSGMAGALSRTLRAPSISPREMAQLDRICAHPME